MKNRNIVLCGWLLLLAITVFSCREEEDNPVSIDKIQFEVTDKDMYVGERATIKLTVTPKEARESNKVEYSASVQGVISIDNEKSSNEGVVFEAVGAGSAVIMARVNGLVEYCNIKVESDPESPIPYISLTDYVIEMKLGTKRHVVASLQGGKQEDQLSFTFSSKDDSVAIDYANNTVVIDGIKAGSARITARHPKAQYSVDVLVFVLNEGEQAKYITGENVVFMGIGSGPVNYSARIVGLSESEVGYCIYQVIEGTEVITVKGSGDLCTIEPKRAGVAKVQVINQGVPYPFEFLVAVRNSDDVKYIELPASFMIINGSDYYSIGASMRGDVPGDYINYYTYNLNVSGIVEVQQSQSNFVIKGLKDGITLLTVSNRYCEFDSQVLILVQNLNVDAKAKDKYIRTSQQVISMEAGKDVPDAILKMELVGGTSADRNNFEWVVEDSSIISVNASGKVSYMRTQINTEALYTAEAIITAKKAGTTRIKISNTKSLNDVTVMVKVYPKGTFNGQAIYIAGPGLIKVQEGKSVEVYAPVIGGNQHLLGITEWSATDSSIAQVSGSCLNGNITGKKSGVTKLKVTGENIAQDYEAVIVVYKEMQEDKIQYAYTDSVHYRITVGQSVKIPVLHPNIADDKFFFTVTNTNKNSIYHVISHDVIIVNGLSEGNGELVVATSGSDCNNITLYINVEPAELAADKPYMLTGANFAGANEGGAVSYTVTMAGANAGKLNGIVWSIDDERVAKVKASAANTAQIEGVAEGQTILRINHGESMNEKAVIVYVVKKGAQVEGKIIIGIEKTNYVMTVNESLFLRLVTNATEAQKLGFKWKTSNADKVIIEENYDTGVITAKEPGSVKVTIYEKDNKHVIDLDIFITVKDMALLTGEIGFPDSILLVKDQNKAVKGNIVGLTPQSADDLVYTLEDQNLAAVTGQGLEVILKGLMPGQSFLTVTSFKLNYYKKILVICVSSAYELDTLYYFTVDRMMYRIKKNEEIKINLLFGENGFPEKDRALIEWSSTSNNQAVLLAAQRGSCNSIIGKNEGQAVIQIKSQLMEKPVEVVIEVSETVSGSDFYRFVYSPIHQFTKNDVKMIPISIYYGSEYYDQNNVYNPGKKMEQGYEGITVDVSDSSVADVSRVGQQLRVTAKKAGKTTVTLSHELIQEDAKLMLAVYDGTIPPVSQELIVFIPKTHWLIQKQEAVRVVLQTNSDNAADVNNVIWNNHNTALFSVDSTDKANALVTGIKEGSGTITVEYGGKVIETVYISVTSAGGAAAASVSTESIIVLSMEDNFLGGYTTRIIINGTNNNNVKWNIADSSIVKIDEMTTMCVLYPLKIGMTELTVSGNGFRKTIIVKVVSNEAEKLTAKLMNFDQRTYKIKRGESYILNPYYKVTKPAYPASAALVFDNKVIQCAQKSNGLEISGKNVGIERLKLYNAQCENEVELEFEVSEAITGGFDEVKSLVYMVTNTPAILIKPEQADYYVNFDVIGEYKGGEDDFKWSSNSGKITVKSFGRYALVSAGKQEGEAEITVSSIFCDGPPLIFKVIIGNLASSDDGSPYIYTSRNVYTMNRGDPDLIIPLEIKNTGAVFYNLVSIKTKGSAVHTSFSDGKIIVKEMLTGTAEITVSYQGIKNEIVLYVVVQERFKKGSAYLTTGQNYVIVNKFNTQVVNINLVNYLEPDSSKFNWSSADASVAYVIGNGLSVQILGMDAGITKITVTHPFAYNDLEILVKVIPAGNSENICYLTTGDNVIETYISSSQGQIGINKVGGVTNVIEAVWSVDNPSIVSVIGNNDIGHYTPRKEGVAKITVTDREAGYISIVVIVRKSRPGDMYIYTPDAIVQITPNSSNNTIKADLSGGEESDEINFKWEIYTQLPSDIDVARQGGGVINIFAMGSRCTVNGIHAGTARIKVTHPKAAEALFILVQVTNFKVMQFSQKNVDMEINDMMYVTLETPDYENLTGKVKYTSDNPSVCTVYGTSKAVLVSSYMAGKAKVTAYVENSDLKAEVDINVIPEKVYEQPYIVTPKTTYILSPRELPFIIEAQIYGVGVSEQDWDSLVWTVKNDNVGMVKIYPENANKAGTSVGRSIQVSVQNKQYVNSNSCIIEISCPHLTRRIKTIFMQVQEDSNAFTLNKYEINMQSGDMAELSCNILGGKIKDFEEVIWMTDKDSFDPTKEIVKIMGKGKNIHLMGINDGVTQVTAVYRGMMRACQIKVKSAVFIGIQYQNFLTYPGERKNDKTLIDIKYEVRPANAFIQWMDTDTDFSNKIASISYLSAVDEAGTGVGRILLDPLREGSFTILAVSNQKTARVNIIVRNDYRFILDKYSIDQPPADVKINSYGQPRDPEDITLHYTISPANVKIVPKEPSEVELKSMGVTLIISPAMRTDEALKGIGTIIVNCEKEIDMDVKFETLQTDGRPTGKDVIVHIRASYNKGEARLVPVFEPVYGVWSNMDNGNSYTRVTGSSRPYAADRLTGQIYNSGRYIPMSSGVKGEQNIRNGNGTFKDVYELVIGDGETHYILLDKINKNAMIDIGSAKFFFDQNNGELGGTGRNVSAREFMLDNGERAVEINGGKDFIIYSNFGSDFDLYCTLDSDDPNVGRVWEPAKAEYLGDSPDLISVLNHCSITQISNETHGSFTGVVEHKYKASFLGGSFDLVKRDIYDSYERLINPGLMIEYLAKVTYDGKIIHGEAGISGVRGDWSDYSSDFKYVIPAGSLLTAPGNIYADSSSKINLCKFSSTPAGYYEFKKIKAKATKYNVFKSYADETAYSGGNIRLDFSQAAVGGGSHFNILIDPIIKRDDGVRVYFQPGSQADIRGSFNNVLNLNRFNSVTQAYNDGFPYMLRNFIVGRFQTWPDGTNPFDSICQGLAPPNNFDVDSGSISQILNSHKDSWAKYYRIGQMYTLLYWNTANQYTGIYDPHTSEVFILSDNEQDEDLKINIKISKGKYEYRGEEPVSYHLRKTLDWFIGGYSDMNNERRQISSINVFKERYNKNSPETLYSYYDPVSQNSANPYRYYPMPSVPDRYSLNFRNEKAYEITIPYRNIYGDCELKIVVHHEIRQCHANKAGPNHPDYKPNRFYKVARSWDETKLIPQTEIFHLPENRVEYLDNDESGFYNGADNKVRIDAGY